MKRTLPMSALITGLMAVPALGIAPPPPAGDAQQGAPLVRAEVFPAEMPGELAAQMRRIARGERLDAFGMSGLQRRIALRMQKRLEGFLEGKA